MAVLPTGTALEVIGCLADYRWCVVITLGERGWVYAANIAEIYEGAPVPVLAYGPVIGIGVITFVLVDCWDLHYRRRPWYRERDRWIHTPRTVQPPFRDRVLLEPRCPCQRLQRRRRCPRAAHHCPEVTSHRRTAHSPGAHP